jgi:hypothetical protein
MRGTYDEYDVVVAGGGISGALAAIAASREGARTLLVEKGGCLGGTLVLCGVGPMMTFHCGEDQIIRGLPGELVERLVARGLSPGHIKDTTGYTYSVTPFDVEGMKQELEMMAVESRVKLLYGASIFGVEIEEGKILGLKFAAKSGVYAASGRVFVDATGDAEIAQRAGLPCRLPRVMQPATMVFRMDGVDTEKLKGYVRGHMEEFPRLKGNAAILDAAPRFSLSGFIPSMAEARKRGEISVEREDLLIFESNSPGEYVVNTSRVFVENPTDPEDLTRLAVEGRKQARELAAFLIKRIPGFERSRLTWSGPEIGIRNSRQIDGVHVLSEEELLSSLEVEDAIAHSAYPIDIHNATDGGSTSRFLPDGKYYDIPYRCLLPRNAKNLIAAGRCVSATFAAEAAIRLSPTAGAIGQAAGTAAAIAAGEGLAMDRVEPTELRSRLRKAGAFLPPRGTERAGR